MRFILFLALFVLPSLAQAQNSNCLIAGQTTRISGKVEYEEDDKVFHWTRTGYIIGVLQPRCYIDDRAVVSDTPVEWIQIVLNSGDPPPVNIGPFAKPVDAKDRRKRLDDWLKANVGKYVAVKGRVDDTSLSVAVFSNPILIVSSIVSCEITPKSRNVRKC